MFSTELKLCGQTECPCQKLPSAYALCTDPGPPLPPHTTAEVFPESELPVSSEIHDDRMQVRQKSEQEGSYRDSVY